MQRRFSLVLLQGVLWVVAANFALEAVASNPQALPWPQARSRAAAAVAIDPALSSQQPLPHTPMPRLLTEPEIKTQAATLPGWTVEAKRLRCERVFKGFPEAVAFVQALVEPAESAGHHPDLKVSYNRVVIELTTHDAGGLTQQDFDLAKVISSLR
jgi:4a-hydroxytetrahydrobiopterin dehydratase